MKIMASTKDVQTGIDRRSSINTEEHAGIRKRMVSVLMSSQ